MLRPLAAGVVLAHLSAQLRIVTLQRREFSLARSLDRDLLEHREICVEEAGNERQVRR